MNDSRLVLASASPRRTELLSRVGIAHEVSPSRADETPRAGEPPRECASRLAAAKAAAVAAARPGALVLAADTVVEHGGEALGKPGDEREAAAMLERLSGEVHAVTTAVALVGPGASESVRVTTEVEMRPLSRAEIEDYVSSGEWRGKAGAYAIQGIAAAFVLEVRGSVTNVIGLPLAEVIELLARAGGPGPRYREGVPA